MAAINFSFTCRICKKALTPVGTNLEMVNFIGEMIQFYKDHDVCEKNDLALKKKEEELKAKYEKPESKKKSKK